MRERPVTIREVNTAQYIVDVEDYFGTNLRASLHMHDPLLAMPEVGEIWLVNQSGTDWFLYKRNESGNETTKLTSLQPGDRRLEGNNLYLNGESVQFNLATKPTVTGSRGGNAALASLISALAQLGLIIDQTTA